MSEAETPVEGAETLPETPAQPEGQETPADPAPAKDDAPKDEAPKEEQPRDEQGRFAQKRINELTRQKYDARREAEQYKQRLEQVEAELQRLRQPAAPDPNVDLPGYIRHQAQQEAQGLIEKERGQWQQQQEQQRFQTLASEYAAKEQEFAAKTPDYQDAVDAFTAVAGVNPQLAEVLMTADYGPEVVHFLGTHLDEAARIAQLPIHLAAREVTRIESRFAPKPKPTTSTPAPVPTLGGSSAASKDPAKMSYADYRKAREEGRIK